MEALEEIGIVVVVRNLAVSITFYVLDLADVCSGFVCGQFMIESFGCCANSLKMLAIYCYMIILVLYNSTFLICNPDMVLFGYHQPHDLRLLMYMVILRTLEPRVHCIELTSMAMWSH